MSTEAKIKVEEIEGIEDLLTKVLIERREEIFGAYAQDIEALRRSPARVALRLEGRVERLEEMVGEIRATMVTKEELAAQTRWLEERMATKEDAQRLGQQLAGLESRLERTEERMATKEDLAEIKATMATKEELQQLEEQMVRREYVEARFEEVGKRLALMQWAIGLLFPFLIAILAKLFLGA